MDEQTLHVVAGNLTVAYFSIPATQEYEKDAAKDPIKMQVRIISVFYDFVNQLKSSSREQLK